MPSRYKTDSHISKEFNEFTEWLRDNDDKSLSTDEMFRKYQYEKDIMFHGELRKLHGVNTRNPNKELLIVTSAALGGILIGCILIWSGIIPKFFKFLTDFF